MDVLAVEDAAAGAVETVRRGGGPHFLELRTYRFRAHSMYDPERYRDKSEVARWRERDPLELLAARLTEAGELTPAAREEMVAELTAEVEAAVAAAEEAPLEPVEDLTRFVLSDVATAVPR
jgi:pyruvate dehydrogenase E1 component alpha subunit